MVVNKKKKKIIAFILIIIAIIVIVPFFIAISIYNDNFGMRFETPDYIRYEIDEFEGLNRKQYTFQSNKGQELVGYTYYKDTVSPKGLIVISHGLGGGGHNSYMDVADYFASNDYIVFAYDGTGNDESEGENIIGLPQSIIDLDYTLKFIKNNDDFSNLPIMLFGQSWGAYTVGSILNVHSDIKAIAMFSGFNSSFDIIKEQGKQMVGEGIQILSPYVSLIEFFKCGKYASYNCVEGFENVDTGIMIVHSADDTMISKENSYDVFYDLYSDNSRFKFIEYEDRGHTYLYYTDEARQNIKDLNEKFKLYKDTLNEEITDEMVSNFFNENMDKESCFELDKKLLKDIVNFYDTYAK